MNFPTLSDFTSFFETDLKPKLQQVEAVRKKIILNNSILITVMTVGFVIETVTWMLIGILVIAVFFFWYTKHYRIPFQYLEQLHEKIIISNVSGFIFSRFEFDADRYVKLKDMQDGLLITGIPKQYGGKNFISCYAGSMQIQISEVKSYSQNQNGHKHKERIHFNGTAAIAKFPVRTNETIILSSESILLDTMQDILPQNIKQEAGNNVFASYTDAENYQSILSPSALLLLKNFADAGNTKFLIIITPSGIYAGVERPHADMIKTELFKSVLQSKSAEEYFKQTLFFAEFFQSVEKKQLEWAE